jgi:hypothetical protein
VAASPVSRNLAATPALANYLNDHLAFLKFNAYLWKMVVKVEYGNRQPELESDGLAALRGIPSPEPRPDGAVTEMKQHTQYLCQMTFCRGVDSYLIYLSGLLTLIVESRPEILKSKEQISLEFLFEHHAAGDLIPAVVEKKVTELSYLGMKDLADYFEKKLGLPIFENQDLLHEAIRYVEIRNLITHNRAVVNRIFLQRQPTFPGKLGESIVFEDAREVGDILGSLVYCARELDARAAAKFDLPLLQPISDGEK